MLFAGQRLDPKQKIKDAGVINGATIFVLIEKSFPEKLGPFATFSLGFGRADFEMPPWSGDFQRGGTMWTMGRSGLQKNQMRPNGVELPLFGQLSPVHPVTLTDQEKEQASIPLKATDFMWSYPVCGWDDLQGKDAPKSYLTVGGFCYFDTQHQIVGTTTLMPMDNDDGGGLQFGPPKTWRSEWTTALMKHGRFHAITIKPLRECGARHFCWLRPGEKIIGEDGAPLPHQPEIVHGGFAYLFHENVFSDKASEILSDRYFSIVSGDEYVNKTVDTNENTFKAFSLASDILELEDARQKLANAASTTDIDKIQREIERLEVRVVDFARGRRQSQIKLDELITLRGWGVVEQARSSEIWKTVASFLHVRDTGLARYPKNVLPILQNGLNERFSGGLFVNGVYAAEDPSKMDQYCAGDGGQSKHKALHKCLYGDKARPRGTVYYCFACRSMVGIPVFTKDGRTDSSSGAAIFQSGGQRELSYIPDSSPPIHYHTLIAEAGADCRVARHREFIFFHSERIVPEYLIAFERA